MSIIKVSITTVQTAWRLLSLYTYLLAYLINYLHTYLRNYSMEQSPLEKLTGSQLVKKFPVFYGTRRFITAFLGARHLSLS